MACNSEKTGYTGKSQTASQPQSPGGLFSLLNRAHRRHHLFSVWPALTSCLRKAAAVGYSSPSCGSHQRNYLSRDPQLLEVTNASCFPHARFPIFSMSAPYSVITRRLQLRTRKQETNLRGELFFFKKTEPPSNLFVPICYEILVLTWVDSLNGHCLLPSRLWGQTVRTRCSSGAALW